MLSSGITMAAASQLINIGNAGYAHHHFLPNRLVMGCYFSARRDTIDHIENTQHNYNGFPWGLVLKPSNIWGCWEEVNGVMDQSSFRHCAGTCVCVCVLSPAQTDLCLQLSNIMCRSKGVYLFILSCLSSRCAILKSSLLFILSKTEAKLKKYYCYIINLTTVPKQSLICDQKWQMLLLLLRFLVWHFKVGGNTS